MTRSYNYTIAQLAANPARGERLNLAIVVFDEDAVSVYSARNLEKVRAISAAINRESIEQALGNINVLNEILLDEGLSSIKERLHSLDSMSSLNFSGLGSFFAQDARAYDSAIERLLKQLVEPEPAPNLRPPQRRTKLLTSIKAAFRSEKVLAKKGEGLDSHRVVPNQELAEGLSADLVLKNGNMHVVQTVDASQAERSKRAIQEIGISALVFEQARISFGDELAKPRLVYSANAAMENAIKAALYAAEHQGADLINWESRDARTRFIVDLSSLAQPTEIQQRANFGGIHASRNKKLN